MASFRSIYKSMEQYMLCTCAGLVSLLAIGAVTGLSVEYVQERLKNKPTSAPVTTSPVTISPVTTSPVTISPVTTSPVTISPVTASASTCLTPQCVELGSQVLSSLDQSVHPCDDFYKFVCNKYLNNTIIPYGECLSLSVLLSSSLLSLSPSPSLLFSSLTFSLSPPSKDWEKEPFLPDTQVTRLWGHWLLSLRWTRRGSEHWWRQATTRVWPLYRRHLTTTSPAWTPIQWRKSPLLLLFNFSLNWVSEVFVMLLLLFLLLLLLFLFACCCCCGRCCCFMLLLLLFLRWVAFGGNNFPWRRRVGYQQPSRLPRRDSLWQWRFLLSGNKPKSLQLYC